MPVVIVEGDKTLFSTMLEHLDYNCLNLSDVGIVLLFSLQSLKWWSNISEFFFIVTATGIELIQSQLNKYYFFLG